MCVVREKIKKTTIPASTKEFDILMKEYPLTCSSPFTSIQTMFGKMFEPARVIYKSNEEEDPKIHCCYSCHTSIFVRHNLPSLSYANYLYIGEVPNELKDLTIIKEAMIARRCAKCCIIYLQESVKKKTSHLPNSQCGVKGHLIIFLSYPEQLIKVLPPSMDDVLTPICVIFVGSAPPTNEWL